jgi:hypothetical protein
MADLTKDETRILARRYFVESRLGHGSRGACAVYAIWCSHVATNALAERREEARQERAKRHTYVGFTLSDECLKALFPPGGNPNVNFLAKPLPIHLLPSAANFIKPHENTD